MTFITDRRPALKLSIAAGVVGLATPQIMVRAAYAQASSGPINNPGLSSFKLGTFKLLSINDGLVASDAPHTTFGVDQDPADVAALLEENFLPADRAMNSFTPVVVNTGGDVVLFDTGLGARARENGGGLLRERLQAAGYNPEDISVVVLTHFHGDHIGGILEEGQPAFPNARYVVGRTEFDFWTAEDRLSGTTENGARAVQASIVPLAEKITFIEDGGEVVPGINGLLAAGHTPGHMIFNIESGGSRIVLTADTANHYVASLRRPDWHVRFDMDKEAGAETRKRVFDMIATDRVPFIGYHMPFPAAGFIEKLEVGYRYVPVSYQLLL